MREVEHERLVERVDNRSQVSIAVGESVRGDRKRVRDDGIDAPEARAYSHDVIETLVRKLNALPNDGSQKRLVVLSMVDVIHAARGRGVPFRAITQTVQSVGINVGERTIRRTYSRWLAREQGKSVGNEPTKQPARR